MTLKSRIPLLFFSSLAAFFLVTLFLLGISGVAMASETPLPAAIDGSIDVVDFVYVDAGVENDSSDLGSTPIAVVGFTDAIDRAGITVEGEDGVPSYVEAGNIDSDAAVFDLADYSDQQFAVTGVYYSLADSQESLCYVSLGDGGEVAPIDADSQADGSSVEVRAYSVDSEGNVAEGFPDSESAISTLGLDDEPEAMSASGVKTIVLDAGHGGSDPGAGGFGLSESNLTLAIATACRDELLKYNKAKVIMTRTDDTYVSLSDRAKIAVDAGADLFVSFHINSAKSSSASGVEVWIPNKSTWYSDYHELGAELGDKVLERLSALGFGSRGNMWKDYPSGSSTSTYPDGSNADYLSVIRNCRAGGVPAILIEHGFISNEHDAALLSSSSFLKQLGVADAQAIVEQLNLEEDPLYGFTDVFLSTAHSSEIGWLAAAGITTGYSDGSFGGMNAVVRQDFAAFLYRLAGSPDYTPTSSDKNRFHDVTEATPHAKEIWWMASEGITTGYSDGTFRGTGVVSRQDMAAFLRRFAAEYLDSSASSWSSSASSVSFSDVTSATPHYEDILWLGSMGVASGYSDGAYRGASYVVRQDMAAFLYRLNNLPSYVPADGDKSSFSDVDDSTPHADAIWWMASAGISNGYSDGTFGGTRNVVRADMAAFLYRLAGSPAYEAPEISPFKDVTSSTPHYKEICWLAAKGISTGWNAPDGKEFRPFSSMARADMAAFLRRFYNSYGSFSQFKDWSPSSKAKLRFSDVDDNTSHCEDIWWLGATGISTGYSDCTFNANSMVNRQDLAEFIRRLYVRCYRGDSIMGASSHVASQLVAAFRASGKNYPTSIYSSKGAPNIEEFVNILISESEAEGVKADVVFCQAMLETGWLQFGGDVKAGQCNFAGIGAVGGGAEGATFNDVREGLRAQVQHLKAYASTDGLKNACVDPRFKYIDRGCAKTLAELSGRWASDSGYGQKIYNLIKTL